MRVGEAYLCGEWLKSESLPELGECCLSWLFLLVPFRQGHVRGEMLSAAHGMVVLNDLFGLFCVAPPESWVCFGHRLQGALDGPEHQKSLQVRETEGVGTEGIGE